MHRTRIFCLSIAVTIQLCFYFILLPLPGFTQDWAIRTKPRGTIKLVDFFIPSDSIMKNYGEGLVILDRENNFVPGLAEDWRWINEKTIEFELRQGVTFHNGEEFNAEAVRANWEAYNVLESPTNHGFLNFPKDTVFQIIDKYTVRFILPEPDGVVFTKFVTFQQFAPAFFKKVGFDEMNWTYLPKSGPWGTGPFKLVKGCVPFGRETEQVVLEANENYWDRRFPKVKRVIFDNTLIADRKEATRLCCETEGSVDILNRIRAIDTLRIAESRYAAVVKSKDVASFWGLINQRKAGSKWKDIRLRKAVNYAINRKELFEYAAKGNAYNLEGFPLPPDAFGYNSNLIPYTYDTKKARKLLEQAGYPQGFELKLLTIEGLKLEAQLIAKMMERVGLTVTLDVLTWQEAISESYLPLMESTPEDSDWDILLLRPSASKGHSAVSLLVWETDQSYWRWIEYDPTYEAMWKEMVKTMDTNAQEEKVRQMVKHWHENGYRLFVYTPLSLYAVNKEVNFVPYKHQWLVLKETSVTENHWSVRSKNN